MLHLCSMSRFLPNVSIPKLQNSVVVRISSRQCIQRHSFLNVYPCTNTSTSSSTSQKEKPSNDKKVKIPPSFWKRGFQTLLFENVWNISTCRESQGVIIKWGCVGRGGGDSILFCLCNTAFFPPLVISLMPDPSSQNFAFNAAKC